MINAEGGRMTIKSEKIAAREKAIKEVSAFGLNAHEGTPPYKLLYLLAKAKGEDMNGSALTVARIHGVDKKLVIKVAERVLAYYLSTDNLIIPSELKARGRKSITNHKLNMYI